MTLPPPALLLDTCALIWIAGRAPLKQTVVAAVRQATAANALFVSPVSAWEIGLLAAKYKTGTGPKMFTLDTKTWFTRFMATPGVRAASFNFDIAIDVSKLPGSLHSDPADRMLISTARHLDVPIVTSDRKIIAYAEQGPVKVLPC